MPGEPALVAALEARLTKFEKQLKEAGTIADREVSKIEGRFSKMNPGSSFLSGFAKAAVGAFTLERAISGVINTIQVVGKIGDTADRVGVTAEQLQELQFALKQSGAEAEQAGPALERFSVAISKAGAGGGLAKFLNDNNVALRDQNGNLRSNGELLSEVANLIKNAESQQDKLNIAAQFFGRQAGPAMVTALSGGSAGLAKLANDARDAGAVLRDETVKEAQRLADQWDKLVDSFTKGGQSAIISGVRAVQGFLDKVEQWANTVLPILRAINQFNPVAMGWDALFGGASGGGFDESGFAEFARSGLAKGPTRFTVTPDPNRRTSTRFLGSGGGRKDEFTREIEQLQKTIAMMDAETAAIDRGTVARDKAKVVAELETAAKQANAAAGLKNTEVTDAQRQKIDEMAAAYERARAASEAANGPLRQFARDAADVNKNLQTAAVDGLKGLEDGLVSIIEGTKTAKEAFSDMAKQIIADLARIAIRQNITGPLAGLFGGGGGLATIFGGARAAGGPVTAGRSYLVGENGPERFVPNSMGRIIPNSALRGGGMTVSIPITIDARGADQGAVMRIGQAVAELKKTLPKQILAVQHNMRTRGTVSAAG